MTTGRRALVKLGVAVGAVVAAMAVAAPQAIASTSESGSVTGYTSSDRTHFGTLAQCHNVFSGPVIATNGSGSIVASITDIAFNFCDAGTSVTPNALPWTLKLDVDSTYTIEGFDVNVSTPQGTCRYSGSVVGLSQFPNAYDMRGSLTRRTAGCGGSKEINISSLGQVIGV
ncbi:hypothetical protein [Rhizomonospora bruguierae]|uniref:hypothetical protein n=1 Tax=Rhizomonospora bruguierae TaxID=1581705 RepID=UPI001BD10CF5|nr:hypothetical protein [Micromonospora sp. NBRC 107566]